MTKRPGLRLWGSDQAKIESVCPSLSLADDQKAFLVVLKSQSCSHTSSEKISKRVPMFHLSGPSCGPSFLREKKGILDGKKSSKKELEH